MYSAAPATPDLRLAGSFDGAIAIQRKQPAEAGNRHVFGCSASGLRPGVSPIRTVSNDIPSFAVGVCLFVQISRRMTRKLTQPVQIRDERDILPQKVSPNKNYIHYV